MVCSLSLATQISKSWPDLPLCKPVYAFPTLCDAACSSPLLSPALRDAGLLEDQVSDLRESCHSALLWLVSLAKYFAVSSIYFDDCLQYVFVSIAE